jgi:hypothetical protein
MQASSECDTEERKKVLILKKIKKKKNYNIKMVTNFFFLFKEMLSAANKTTGCLLIKR